MSEDFFTEFKFFKANVEKSQQEIQRRQIEMENAQWTNMMVSLTTAYNAAIKQGSSSFTVNVQALTNHQRSQLVKKLIDANPDITAEIRLTHGLCSSNEFYCLFVKLK